MELKLNEAFTAYKKSGKSKSHLSVGRRLWPNAIDHSVSQNMSRLITGKTKTIKLEWLDIIANELECTVPQLLGLEPFGDGE